MKKLAIVTLLMIACLLPAVVRADQISDVLAKADTWIISDTARIMAYIDSCDQAADTRLRASKYWDDTYRDLSFLLGIDYVGSAEMDNTGRIYFMMRITGEIARSPIRRLCAGFGDALRQRTSRYLEIQP